MKRLIYIIVLVLETNILFAQDKQKGVYLSHYVFPEFINGTVLKKSGSVEKAPLNYNALTEEMIFENGEKRLALTQISTIDTVYIADRKFVPGNSFFYEVVNTKAPVSLFVKHTCSVETPGSSVGYGATTQTSSATSLSSIVNSRGGIIVYDLHLPDGYKVTPQTEFWLKKQDDFVKINGIKPALKVFPDKKDLIKEFTDKNHTNFNKQDDLVELINYINK